MFFSSAKKDKQAKSSLIQQSLCDFFSIAHSHSALFDVIIGAQQISIALPFACSSRHGELHHHLLNLCRQNKLEQSISLTTNIPIFDSKPALLPRVKNIIAVSSGKGGVGKSATAVNLACALKLEGARVGILDTDIYGPSLPMMLGNSTARPEPLGEREMQPIMVEGIAVNSIGYLLSAEHAAIWRGPMASKAITQLVSETHWPLLDYLILDLPPGTGDIHLTLTQQVPISGAIVVTTPQNIATADAQKGIAMFNKLNIPVLGLVENMSYFDCDCGKRHYPFAQGGSARLLEQSKCELLAQIPLTTSIQECADTGQLLMMQSKPDLKQVQESYRALARATSLALAMQVPVHKLAKQSGANPEQSISIVQV